jgi:Arc/MetJ family transcription regulator
MRTNVVLDAALVEQAKALTGIKTTRALIDEALRLLVQLREQSQVRDLRGRLRWEGDLAALRESRFNGYEVADQGSLQHVAD